MSTTQQTEHHHAPGVRTVPSDRWIANCSCGEWHPPAFISMDAALAHHGRHKRQVELDEQFTANAVAYAHRNHAEPEPEEADDGLC